MLLLHIVILAIVQGISEFLPVSSSGHLVLLPHLAGWQDQGRDIDIAVHVGTLGAVLVYFWRDILAILAGFAGGRRLERRRRLRARPRAGRPRRGLGTKTH